jgi:hypothetical protein
MRSVIRGFGDPASPPTAHFATLPRRRCALVYIEFSAMCRHGLNKPSIMSPRFSSFVRHKGWSNGFRQTIFAAQQSHRAGHPADLRAVQRHRPRPRARSSNSLQSLRWNWKSERQIGSGILIERLASSVGRIEPTDRPEVAGSAKSGSQRSGAKALKLVPSQVQMIDVAEKRRPVGH